MIESENPNIVRDNPKKFKYWITVLYERYINFLDDLLILVVIVLSSIILIALYKNNSLIHLFDSSVFDGIFTFIIIFIFIIIIAGLVRSVYHIIVTLALLIILIGSITFACGIWRFDENNNTIIIVTVPQDSTKTDSLQNYK